MKFKNFFSIFSFNKLPKIFTVIILAFLYYGAGFLNSNAIIINYGTNVYFPSCDTTKNICSKYSTSISSTTIKDIANYKFANTTTSISGSNTGSTFNLSTFNIDLDEFIRLRLYDGYYFGLANVKNKLSTPSSALLDKISSLSDKDNNLLLLNNTLLRYNTQDERLRIAKYVTKSLAGSDSTFNSTSNYPDVSISTLFYYYLSIYKITDQYLSLNKNTIDANNLSTIQNLNSSLGKAIYDSLYKTSSIANSEGCNSDTDLKSCTVFKDGKFVSDANGSDANMEFNVVTNEVNKLSLDAKNSKATANDLTNINGKIADSNPNTVDDSLKANSCPVGISISDFIAPSWTGAKDTSHCDFIAYLINSLVSGLARLFGLLTQLLGALFNWVFDFSVIKFSLWVTNSGALTIYKTIILSLMTTLVFPILLYLVIRMLFSNDDSYLKKILPRVLLMAVFVYFSFNIVGFLIDQSNIITIYLYRSITLNGSSSPQLGTSLIDSLDPTSQSTSSWGGNGISMGDWNVTPLYLGELAVAILGIFILAQASVLFFSRTISLLLCMIFSPLILFPEGLISWIDPYRKKIIDNTINGLIMAPIFMLLFLIATKIGSSIGDKLKGSIPIEGNAVGGVTGPFLNYLVISVLVVVVLQLAITVAKNLSGDIGQKISATVGKVAGNVGGAAFGLGKTAGKALGNGAMNKIMSTNTGQKVNDWINKGSAKSGFRGTLFKGAQNFTGKYDAGTRDKAKANTNLDNYKNMGEDAQKTHLAALKEEEGKYGENSAKGKTARAKINEIEKFESEKKYQENKKKIAQRQTEDWNKMTGKTNQESKDNESSKENKTGSTPLVTSNSTNTPPKSGNAENKMPEPTKEDKQNIQERKEKIISNNGGKEETDKKISEMKKRQENNYQDNSLKEAKERLANKESQNQNEIKQRFNNIGITSDTSLNHSSANNGSQLENNERRENANTSEFRKYVTNESEEINNKFKSGDFSEKRRLVSDFRKQRESNTEKGKTFKPTSQDIKESEKVGEDAIEALKHGNTQASATIKLK